MTPTSPEAHQPEPSSHEPHGLVRDDELGPEFWAAELALFNEFCLDDPLPEDPEEADAADHEYQEWLERHRQPDGSLPLTEELHEQVESAFFDAVSSATSVLAANLTDREPPKVGTPFFGAPVSGTPVSDTPVSEPETPAVYSASDRVRDIAERIVAIDQAERVLSAAKTKLYAQIPYSFISDGHVTPDNSLHADSQGMGILSAANLISIKTRTSDSTVKGHINYAYTIADSLPEVLAALEDGVISFAHAIEIAKASSALPENGLRKYSRDAIKLASSNTPGRLRRKLQKLVAATSPECQHEQSKRAYQERRVWVEEYENGMAMLGAILPAPLAIAAADRITQIAKHTMQDMQNTSGCSPVNGENRPNAFQTQSGANPAANSATSTDDSASTDNPASTGGAAFTDSDASIDGDPSIDTANSWTKDSRTLNQARADVLAELLLSSTSQRPNPETGAPFGLGIDAKIQLSVPVSVFTAKPTTPTTSGSPTKSAPTEQTTSPATAPDSSGRTDVAELHGYGLIDPEIARQFALDANSWDRIFISKTNQVVGTDNYVPTAAIKRFLWARDQHCRFPGCLAPPSRCEIDHTYDWAKGGRTNTENLALLCKRHHALKHPSVHQTSRWQVTQHPGGILEWKSPDGQVFADLPDPPPTVAITPHILKDPSEVANLKESIADSVASSNNLPPNISRLVTSQKKYTRVVAFEEVVECQPLTIQDQQPLTDDQQPLTDDQPGFKPRKRLRKVTAEFDVEPVPPPHDNTPWGAVPDGDWDWTEENRPF